MRTMYDALNPHNIPPAAQMVASYIDGPNAPEAGWELLFPHAVIVKIARLAQTDDGHVLDAGDNGVTPGAALDWVRLRRSSGADPTVYTNRSQWPGMRAAFVTAGEPEPHWWIAAPGSTLASYPECVAVQCVYAGGFDQSEVVDHWPGVDSEQAPVPEPQPVAAGGTYTVVPGDSMWAIAQRHGITLAEIEAANPSAGHPAGNFGFILSGDELVIPAPAVPLPAVVVPRGTSYTVVPGDAMWSIAARHGVSLAALERANPAAGHPAGNARDIWPGDVLTIP